MNEIDLSAISKFSGQREVKYGPYNGGDSGQKSLFDSYDMMSKIYQSPEVFNLNHDSNKKAIDLLGRMEEDISMGDGKDSLGMKKRLEYGADISLSFH